MFFYYIILYMKKEYFVLYTPDCMNKAFDLLNKDISGAGIFSALKTDDDILKQVCLLKLNKVSDNNEAELLVSVLTGQHGPVREICSAKINQFMKCDDFRGYFSGNIIRQTVLNALNDIIPTVARNITEVIKFFPEKDILIEELLLRIVDVINTDEDKIESMSNHEIIKKTFKLYWYLEALAEFTGECEQDIKFRYIIEKTYLNEDYTIREKVAKILSETTHFSSFIDTLKSDANPYVYSYLVK